MKNIYKIITLVLVFAITIVSCEKDAIVINTFEFEIAETHEESATINYQQLTTLNIISDTEFSEGEYLFSYKFLEGSGRFVVNDTELEETEEIKLLEASSGVFFVGGAIGINKVEITVNNSGEVIKKLELIYDVKHNSCVLEMTSPVTGYAVDEFVPVKVNLLNTGIDQSVTYVRTFFLLEGEGELYTDDETTVIPLEEELPITVGETNYNLKFSVSTQASFLIRTEDRNGQIKEATLIFNGAIPQLSVEQPTPNEFPINSLIDLNTVINESIALGSSYTIKFESNNVGLITFDGTPYAPGDKIEGILNVNATFPLSYMGTVVGEHELKFTLESDLGVEYNTEVILLNLTEVNPVDFTFNASASTQNNTVIINTCTPINIDLTGPTDGEYRLKWDAAVSGVFTYEGIDYSEDDLGTGILIDINNIDPNACFSATSPGISDLNLNVTLGSDTITESFDFEVLRPFELNVESSPDTGTVGKKAEIILSILENAVSPDDDPYKIKFESDKTSFITYADDGTEYIPGSVIELNPEDQTDLEFSFNYNAFEAGIHTLTYTLIGNAGVEYDAKTITIVYSPNAPVAKLIVPAGPLIVNNDDGAIDLNMSITESTPNSGPYSIKFISDKAPSIIYGPNVYNNEGIIPLNPEDQLDLEFIFNYFGVIESGIHTIDFTLLNEAEDIVDVKRITIDFVIATSDVSFNVTTSNNTDTVSVDAGSPTPLNVIITETGVSQGPYRIFIDDNGIDGTSISLDGVLLGELPLEIDIDPTVLNPTLTYLSQQGGANILDFKLLEATAAGAELGNKQITVNVDTPDFTLTADNASTAIINEQTPIIITLEGVTSSEGIYTAKWNSTKSGECSISGVGEVAADEEFTFTGNEFKALYTGLEAGVTGLEFIVSDGNVTKTIAVDLTIEDDTPTSLLSVRNISDQDFPVVGDELTFAVDINENGIPNTPYDLEIISRSDGNIIFDGTNYGDSALISNITDLSFVINYVGLEEDTHDLVFTLFKDNARLDQESLEVKIDDDPFDFDFNLTELPGPTVLINRNTPIKFNIKGPNAEYKMKWEADVDGQFLRELVAYEEGEEIIVPAGDFSGFFKGFESGISNLKFTVEAEGVTKTIEIDLNVNEFTFTLDIPEEILVSLDPVDFNINYSTSITDNVNAKLSYTILSDKEIIRQDNNQTLENPHELMIGDLGLTYTFLVLPTNGVITWVYENDLGISETYTTNVVVSNNSIDFELSDSDIGTSVATNANFSAKIIENGISLGPYSIIVSSNDKLGTITYNNDSSAEFPKTYNNITNLNLPFTYFPREGGDHKLVLALIGNDRVEIGRQEITVSVSTPDFVFNAESVSSILLVDEAGEIKLNLSGGVPLGQFYRLKWEADVNGVLKSSSSSVDILEGEELIIGTFASTNNEFIASSTGESNLTFTITDGNVTKTATVDLTIVDSLLDLTFGDSQGVVNERIEVKALVNGDFSNGTVYDLRLESNNTGKISVNGTNLALPHTFTNIMDAASANIKFDYIGTEEGNYRLNFTVVNNSNGAVIAEETKTLSFISPVTFKVTPPPGGGQANQVIPLDVKIIENGANSDFGPYKAQ